MSPAGVERSDTQVFTARYSKDALAGGAQDACRIYSRAGLKRWYFVTEIEAHSGGTGGRVQVGSCREGASPAK